MSECPPPNIYPGTPEHEYRAWDAESQSLLRVIPTRSEAHYRQERLEPSEPTPAKEAGTAVHHAILEPEIFEEEYVCGITADRRTKAGKAAWAAFADDNKGKTVLDAKVYDMCLGMRDAVWDYPTAVELLGGRGGNEVAIVAEHRATGLMRKGLVDRLTEYDGYPAIVDLKSTQDASEESFAKSIARYGYAFQAAYYTDILHDLAPVARRFVILAVEKTPPYCPQAHEVTEIDMDQGRDEYERALERLAAARASGIYPGYPQGLRYTPMPRWARKEIA